MDVGHYDRDRLVLVSTQQGHAFLGYAADPSEMPLTLRHAIPLASDLDLADHWNLVTVGPAENTHYPQPATVVVQSNNLLLKATQDARSAWAYYWRYYDAPVEDLSC